MGATHAVMVSSRDPRTVVDHGRMAVLRTALGVLDASFDRVTVCFLRPSTVDGAAAVPHVDYVQLPDSGRARQGNSLRRGSSGTDH
ncbi:MAG: hypothetical protein R2710_26295 [Acidimicrobiales bacterium]